MAGGLTKKQKKQNQIIRLYELLGKSKQIVIVGLENVGSLQVQQVRKELAKHKGLLVIGKNTVIKKAISLRLQDLPADEDFKDCKKFGGIVKELEALQGEIKNKIGLILTEQPVFEVKNIVEANKVSAAARVGMIAPIDVTAPAGPTGMDPSQISFFHALQISTKIEKGQINILKDYQVCFKGRKVENSQASLLQKLNMKPFFYNMVVIAAYDNGSILDKEMCSLTTDDILSSFSTGVKNLTALSLQTGIPTQLSVGHTIVNAFKNLAAIGLQIDYKFKQLSNASSAPAQAPKQDTKAAKAPEKKEEPKKEEPKKEEEEDVDMGGLFD